MSMDELYNVLAQIRDHLGAISKTLEEISVLIPSGSGLEIEELNFTMKQIRDSLYRIEKNK